MGNDVDPLEDAENLIAEGRADEAAALLGRHIAQGRGGVLMRLTLAHALLLSGKTAEALEMSRETAQLYPGVAGAALALGETLLTAGKLPLAIAEFQRALRIDPDQAKAVFLLGCAWLEAGEPDHVVESITGHLSRRMLEHYSHIRLAAKKAALDKLGQRRKNAK